MVYRFVVDLVPSLLAALLSLAALLLAVWLLVRLARAARTAFSGAPTYVMDYEAGVLYRNGRMERSLQPGRYRAAEWRGQRIVVVDTRRQTLVLGDQRVLTADHVPVGLTVSTEYEVADPRVALHSVASFRDRLYEDAQLAARDAVCSVTVDEMLAGRAEVNARMQARLADAAATYGVRVLQVGLKDIVLSARVRDMLMREAEARRTAQATLVSAREEVAALRAMGNAARMVRESPELLRLRELETIRTVAQAGGNTVVVSLGGAPSAVPGIADPALPEA